MTQMSPSSPKANRPSFNVAIGRSSQSIGAGEGWAAVVRGAPSPAGGFDGQPTRTTMAAVTSHVVGPLPQPRLQLLIDASLRAGRTGGSGPPPSSHASPPPQYGERTARDREGAMDKVVHFEIPVDDEGRAKSFYGSVFGWGLNDSDMGGGVTYTTVMTVGVDQSTMMPT